MGAIVHKGVHKRNAKEEWLILWEKQSVVVKCELNLGKIIRSSQNGGKEFQV